MKALQAKALNWYKQNSTLAIGGLLVFSLAAYLLFFQFPPTHGVPQTHPLHINPVKLEFGATQPLPQVIQLDANKVALGERLFNDVRLSGNNTISCASCHDLTLGGTDGRPRSVGVDGKTGNINAPTVFNSGFNFVQFWNGRAATLEDQVDGPVNNSKEMASNWEQVVAKLIQDKLFVQQFRQTYPDGLSSTNIKDAIATFERSLVTPNSRFDQYLRGNKEALSDQAKHGYELFQSYGCSSCHQGINLGGNMFEKMGLLGDYFADRGGESEADLGRFSITRNPEHMHDFKVPSLRNVALTAPYFHDANAETLHQAVTIMARYQLGRNLSSNDIEAIVAFLESLTGEYRGKQL
jgi:cytochrome c peroxidase